MTRSGSAILSRRSLLRGASVAALCAGRVGAQAVRPDGPGTTPGTGSFPVRDLLRPDLTRSLDRRNLAKPVHARLLLDDMETDGGWQATPAVQLGYTRERSRGGRRSLRATVFHRDEALLRAARMPNGSFNGGAILLEFQPGAALLTRRFDPPQDWSAYNRLSLWCYVHPGNPLNALALEFVCDGASAGPNDPVAVNYIGDLVPGAWNQLVWEIPEHRRDRVSSLTIFQPRWGTPFPDSGPAVTYDFDQLELHRVDAEPVEGWAVTPGRIAYCHTGYAPDARKVAIAPDGPETRFALLDANGHAVAEFDAEHVANRRGRWRRLDFSRFDRSGRWRLRCGEATSEPFPITAAPWAELAEATLNAFYGLRCGCIVPGVHAACHLDVFVEHDGRRFAVAGGWHDAGNLTQSANNTHLSIYALVVLADGLRATGQPALAERADEEARWGLDWSLRLRLGHGERIARDPASFYSDDKLGTEDDVVATDARLVARDPFANACATLAYAQASRSMARLRPDLARALRAAAIEDFAALEAQLPLDGSVPSDMNQGGSGDQLGYAAVAAVDLFRLTGETRYREAARRYGRAVLATQEAAFVDGIPVAGWFYDDPHRTRITHEFHSSYEESRLLALEALCDTFPDDPAWIEWYGGVVRYSEYFCRKGGEASAPFAVLPAAVWRRTDLSAGLAVDRMGAMLAAKPNGLFPTPPSSAQTAADMAEQFAAAADLGADHRLRVFPLWYDHIRHGASVVHLTKAVGVAAAAQLRRRPDLAGLAAGQLQWTLGANPFSRSLVYGVGKDWWQNFTVEVPNLVGGVAVGMNSYRHDSPAWGNNAVFPYKEIWVMGSCRVALLVGRLLALPAATAPAFTGSAQVSDGSTVKLRLDTATGIDTLQLRLLNLAGDASVSMQAGGPIEKRFAVVDRTRSWTIVAVPDHDVSRRVEWSGTATPLRAIV